MPFWHICPVQTQLLTVCLQQCLLANLWLPFSSDFWKTKQNKTKQQPTFSLGIYWNNIIFWNW